VIGSAEWQLSSCRTSLLPPKSEQFYHGRGSQLRRSQGRYRRMNSGSTLFLETQEVVHGVVEKGKIVEAVTDRRRVVAVG
jgi:hypothetical protein